MKSTMKHGIFLAILAAGLYALSSPFSKLLLAYMPPTLMAGFLYLGAGLGMIVIFLIRKMSGRPERESGLTRQELPYTVAMVLLDIAAPICLLFGLSMTTAANASLLIFREIPGILFIAALALMVIGAWLSSQDKPLSESFSLSFPFSRPGRLQRRSDQAGQ